MARTGRPKAELTLSGNERATLLGGINRMPSADQAGLQALPAPVGGRAMLDVLHDDRVL